MKKTVNDLLGGLSQADRRNLAAERIKARLEKKARELQGKTYIGREHHSLEKAYNEALFRGRVAAIVAHLESAGAKIESFDAGYAYGQVANCTIGGERMSIRFACDESKMPVIFTDEDQAVIDEYEAVKAECDAARKQLMLIEDLLDNKQLLRARVLDSLLKQSDVGADVTAALDKFADVVVEGILVEEE